MPKRPTRADKDNPIWSAEDFRRAKPATSVLPPDLVALLPRRRGQRGPQRKPAKQLVSLRIDAEVLSRFRATGAGWQSRINEVLEKAAPKLAR